MSIRQLQSVYSLYLKYYLYVLTVILVTSAQGQLTGQDIIFSQYYSAPIHINSGFTGLSAYPNLNANYRLQWPGFSKTYETFAVSYDQLFKKQNLGVGAIVLSDSQGDGSIKTNKFKGLVSYNLQFSRDWQLKFGIGVAYAQNQLDWDKLIFFDQIDPQYGSQDRFGNPNISTEAQPMSLSNGYLDVDFGLLVYNPRYYLGLSMFHVNAPYNGFLEQSNGAPGLEIPVMISLQAGYQVILQKDNKGQPKTFVSPNILYATQSGFSQINIGAYLQKDAVFGGVWMRHTIDNIDAFIFVAGVHMGNLKIGYSFDLTTARLGPQTTGGSHEIAITMALKQFERKESKLNDCFGLFR